jgi:signal transduction histidine kinase/predicted CoA-binding protein
MVSQSKQTKTDTTIQSFLRKLPLFADLPEEDLNRLCEMVEEVDLPKGTQLFAEGAAGDRAYIIREGLIEIIKRSARQDVLLAIRQSGDMIGEMSLLEESPRMASARGKTDSQLLAIRTEDFDHLLATSPSAARAMLHTISDRLRATEAMLRQSDKMSELGTLTAGIAHELNNPAAAAQRGSDQLRQAVHGMQQAHRKISELGMDQAEMDRLMELDQVIQESAIKPADLDPISRSDLEAEMEEILDELGVPEAWEKAPILVNGGYSPEDIKNLGNSFLPEQIPAVIEWAASSYSVYTLLEEISQGAERIAEIVKALKMYVYLDQAPIQSVDIHEGLNNTLVLLRSKLKTGVNVQREYQPALPKVQAFGSELNQVWTNIIDNAIDAMQGKGDVVIRTMQEEDWVIVQIEDNGPGIPEGIRNKIFDPFFTTKEPGKGTGLGLNISYNIIQKHGGQIRVNSRPGKTCFETRLPVDFERQTEEKTPIQTIIRPDDNTLKQILQSSHNLAVVGVSDEEIRPSHSIAAYLQERGYRIFPVNPNVDTILNEKTYPDIDSIPDPVDVVLIFRRSEHVPPIVDQAIRKGAKVVWMQEGIVNETAAGKARDAGLTVVMGTCMRASHRRLIAPTPLG